MSDLEQMLRDQFASDAEHAPLVHDLTAAATGMALRVRRMRRLAGGLAAVAAAVAVLAAGVWINASPTAGNRPVQHPVHVPKPTPVPKGQQLVSYHGVEIQVPQSWRTLTVHCDPTSVNAVVLDDNEMWPCSLLSVPKITGAITVVHLVPDTLAADEGLAQQAVKVNGISALTGSGPGHGRTSGVSFEGHTVTVLSLPDPGVLIEVTSPIPGMAQKIFDTVRLAPTDHLGCAASVDSKIPSGNSPAASLMGDKSLVRAVACRYVPRLSQQNRPPYWLAGSRKLTLDEISFLREALSKRAVHVPSVSGININSSYRFFWYMFTYQDGSTRAIAIMDRSVMWSVTDGLQTVSLPGPPLGAPGALIGLSPI